MVPDRKAMKKPLISLFIPAYNEEKDIVKCLRSIAKQTIANRIEVIIVDDSSTDRTVDIAKSFNRKNGLTIRIIQAETKHEPEHAKRTALSVCRGKYCSYFDADMEMATEDWCEQIIEPLESKRYIAGAMGIFAPNDSQNMLTRYMSQDIFQRDPIFKQFTPDISESIVESVADPTRLDLTYIERDDPHGALRYNLCEFRHADPGLDISLPPNIPAQSLILYRTNILKTVLKEDYFFMDNDVPVKLCKAGHNIFAFVPGARVYHNAYSSLIELWNKRQRGVSRTYLNNLQKREYRWIDLSKWFNWVRLSAWVIYANTFILPMLEGICEALYNEDACFLYRPLVVLVSTDALIWGFLKNGGKRELMKRWMR